MAMTIELPALERTDDTASPAPSGRLRRWTRPALGLLLPVGLALASEIVVRLGLSNGRLMPPPTKLFATIPELARSGELTRHIGGERGPCCGEFGLGVIAARCSAPSLGLSGSRRPLLDPTVQALRAIP